MNYPQTQIYKLFSFSKSHTQTQTKTQTLKQDSTTLNQNKTTTANPAAVELEQRIQYLPHELCDIIYSYIPLKKLLFVTKSIYTTNHSLVKSCIRKDQYENYIRDMIRRDNAFVLDMLLRENFERWLFFKKYYYNVTVYSNYIYFLMEFSIINHSDNCKNVVKQYLVESGLSKNQHKKKTSQSIRRRWTN